MIRKETHYGYKLKLSKWEHDLIVDALVCVDAWGSKGAVDFVEAFTGTRPMTIAEADAKFSQPDEA